MIQLFINQVPTDMNEGVATIQKGAGLLDFEALDPTISMPFNLPYTKHNRKIFKHAEHPSTIANLGIYPAHVEHDGLIIEEGEFVLKNGEPRIGYEGFFRSDAGVIASRKDELIGDILAGYEIALQDDSYTLPQYQEDLANIVMPPIAHRRMIEGREHYEEFLILNRQFLNSPERSAPCFKIHYLLGLLFTELGYQVKKGEFTYLHERMIMIPSYYEVSNISINGVPLEPTVSYKKFLKEIKLSDFIRSCRVQGFSISINSKFKTVTIESISSSFSKEGADWTGSASTQIRIEQAGDEGSESTFEYAYAPEEERTRFDGDFDNAAEGDIMELPEFGMVYIAKLYGDAEDIEEGREVTRTTRSAWNTGGANSQDPAEPNNINYIYWDDYGPSSYPLTLSKGNFGGKSDFVPCPSTSLFHFRAEGLKIRQSNGNIKIVTMDGFMPLTNTVQFRVIEPAELGQQWNTEVLPRANSGRVSEIELPIPYTKDYDSVIVEYRISILETIPYVMQAIADHPLISIYHGIFQSDFLNDPWPLASPSAKFATQAAPAPDPSRLCLEGENGIIEAQMPDLKRIAENGKLATFNIRPTPRQLAGFAPIAPITVDGVKFMPKDLELVFGKGVGGKFEGWVV